ncbi:PREDICTED: zinc finger CCCH domain-containing protein 67-like [Tarenaya hassleriana]|uniref:zinc finger CCCH domain-containing protein 67-like n=1 Tax=Tarenaya hassleriana TaxID=28532 RepID=UPI0008FD6977|nr:PREDICTED: zinc finger CCCH domain-containing protein 67-like [Tarenaya hassleriana]
MRNGSCKFGASCKFDHPDPKAVGGADPAPVYVNGVPGGSTPSQANVASWSIPRPSNETAPYVPVMSSTRGVPSQFSEWNGYQTPAYPQERSMRPSAAFANNTATGTSIYGNNQEMPSDDEFPERPGEPACSFFLKTGECKFKSNCKYHHPKIRPPKPPPCVLSDKGLPLRPDQNICSHYSRYGICKFGPACKFNHPTLSVTDSDIDKPVASTN